MSSSSMTCVVHNIQCMLRNKYEYSDENSQCEQNKKFIPISVWLHLVPVLLNHSGKSP